MYRKVGDIPLMGLFPSPFSPLKYSASYKPKEGRMGEI